MWIISRHIFFLDSNFNRHPSKYFQCNCDVVRDYDSAKLILHFGLLHVHKAGTWNNLTLSAQNILTKAEPRMFITSIGKGITQNMISRWMSIKFNNSYNFLNKKPFSAG